MKSATFSQISQIELIFEIGQFTIFRNFQITSIFLISRIRKFSIFPSYQIGYIFQFLEISKFFDFFGIGEIWIFPNFHMAHCLLKHLDVKSMVHIYPFYSILSELPLTLAVLLNNVVNMPLWFNIYFMCYKSVMDINHFINLMSFQLISTHVLVIK